MPHIARCLRSTAVILSFSLLWLAPTVPGSARDNDPAADAQILKAASALYDGIQVHTLDNGLKVYLKPIPGAPTVTTMVPYKVGSADEDLTATGLSHYLEHLMFKGTKKIKPGDIDRVTQRNGGSNNAYTDTDYTIYHFDFAADRWEPALDIEADRMRNLVIDKEHEFEPEKGNVVSELNRDEDMPWDLEQKAILPLLFGKTGPYGHPVIGEKEHVYGATDKIIKAHYDKWYHPNNASIVVVGGFDAPKTLEKIKKLFGSIPKKELPERKPLGKEELKRPARKEFPSKFEVARLLVGYNTISNDDPDYPALTVLGSILSDGKTCRLYKNFVEGAEIASAVNAGNNGGRYPGWFGFQVELIPGKTRAEAEALLLKEIEKIRTEPVSVAELKRAKRGILAGRIFSSESVHGLADSIAQAVTVNDLDYLKKSLPSLLAVTAADVQRVAKKYLDPEKRVTVWSVPKGYDKKGGAKDGKEGTDKPQAPAVKTGGNNRARAADAAAGAGALSLKDAKRLTLPNGLVLLLLENHRVPVVVAAAHVNHVGELEPVEKPGLTRLMGTLLDEGTEKHTGEQIAEMIENVGGNLSLSSSGGTVAVLSPDRALGLRLLIESLTQANFPKEAFERNKGILLAEVAEAEAQPNNKARSVFGTEVYGKHPYGRSILGKSKQIMALTRGELKEFYHKLFVPNNTTLAVVGDFDSKALVAEIEMLTKDWKKSEVAVPKLPEVEKSKEPINKILSMPDAAQLHLYMGHVGIKRSNPDYYKLLVLDNVLGTGPGFTDRLSARIRDREGLAYTVRASIADSANVDPGLFVFYSGIEPKNFERVKKEFLEELNRLRDEKPTAEEVDDAKSYLLGKLAFRMNTNAEAAGELLNIEKYNLGFDTLEKYRKEVAAVTPEDVQAMAKKYLDPKRLILVAAGAIDETGKPLKKE